MSRTTTIGFRGKTKIAAREKSHCLKLTARLVKLGIIGNYFFNWVSFQHDDGCKSILSGSSLDCFCNCEAVIGGERYSFNQYVRDAERVQ